jgi:hypothetical protein
MAACQELLRQGLPSMVPRELDDQHHFIPLAADINGAVAVTVFVRQMTRRMLAGVPGLEALGLPGLEDAIFQQRDGNWVYLGGGSGGPFEGHPLTERPPAASQHGYLRPLSSGQICLRGTHRFPRRTRYAFYAMLRASAEIHRLQAGTRVLDVPFHGYAVLTWVNRRGRAVIALTQDGTQLASIDLSRDPSVPALSTLDGPPQ